MSFAAVKFLNANTTAVVPCSWMFEDKCFWPPNNVKSKILPLIEKGVAPSETWDLFTTNTLGIYETYSDAWLKLLIEKEQLNIELPFPNSFSTGKRKKRKRQASSSSEDDDNCLAGSFTSSLPDFKKYNKRPLVQTISVEREAVSSCNTTEESSGPLVIHTSQNGREHDLDNKIDVSSCSTSEELLVPLLLDTSPDGKEHESDYKIKDYLKSILEELKYLKNRQKVIEGKLDKVLREVKKVPSEVCIKTTENLPPEIIKLFPLSDMESLQILELELADQELANKMIHFLVRVGGGTCTQTVNHFLRKLMTDSLATNFSYLGQREKLPFKDLNICRVIIDAVRSKEELRDVLETEITKCISNWLRHAKSRMTQYSSSVSALGE